jgi:prophage antirepressor-like protein
MESKIQVFNNKEFGEVRIIEVEGQSWWVLKDVCKVLGLTSTNRVAERLDRDEVSQTHLIDSIGRRQKNTLISESGLYAVILRSDKPNAHAFRKWLTSEVIPQIRKTGAYITDELLAKLATSEQERDEFFNALVKSRKEQQKLVNSHLKTLSEFKDTLAENRELKNERGILEDCIGELLPSADYCDTIDINSSSLQARS